MSFQHDIFNSPAEIATECAAYRIIEGASQWNGYESIQDSIRFATEGDTSLVKDAEAILDKIEVSVENEVHQWGYSVGGVCPNVPRFLAGEPECYNSKQLNQSEKSPVKIWVGIASNSQVSPADFKRRGIAVLALVMHFIKSGRAVELWTYTATGGLMSKHTDSKGRKVGSMFVVCKMPTLPVNISVIAYCLTSIAFLRNLHQQLGYKKYKYDGHYCYCGNDDKAHKEIVLQGLYSEGDILVKAMRNDGGGINEDEILLDPVAWINKTVNEQNERQ